MLECFCKYLLGLNSLGRPFIDGESPLKGQWHFLRPLGLYMLHFTNTEWAREI